MSPLLLLVLAGLWAAVLIPATRGSRDAAYDGRSMQGFSTAMRVLSRRAAPADGRRIMLPTETVATSTPTRRLRERRRRTFVRLLWAAGLSLLAAVALRGPWPAIHVVVDTALVAYAVRLRRAALAAADAARAARRAELARREAEHRAAYEAAHEQAAAATAPAGPAPATYVRPVRLPAYPPGDERRASGE